MVAFRLCSLLLVAMAALAPALSAASGAPQLQGPLVCLQRSQALAQDPNALISQLSSCVGGPTPACCSQANGLFGFGNGQLAGCLCYPGATEQALNQVSSNELARSVGVTRETVLNILVQCKVPFQGPGGSGCPAHPIIASKISRSKNAKQASQNSTSTYQSSMFQKAG